MALQEESWALAEVRDRDCQATVSFLIGWNTGQVAWWAKTGQPGWGSQCRTEIQVGATGTVTNYPKPRGFDKANYLTIWRLGVQNGFHWAKKISVVRVLFPSGGFRGESVFLPFQVSRGCSHSVGHDLPPPSSKLPRLQLSEHSLSDSDSSSASLFHF
jgi:hypothetical protein